MDEAYTLPAKQETFLELSGKNGIWELGHFQDGSVLTSAVEAWLLQCNCC